MADRFVWEGRMELALASFIESRLAEDPPPVETPLVGDLHDWARDLRGSGLTRLAASGRRELRRVA